MCSRRDAATWVGTGTTSACASARWGAYDVSTIFRPGAYLSLGYASGPWVGELHGGFNLVFDGQVGGRADLAVRCGISRIVAPGFGFAVSSAQQISPEGRVFIVFTP